MWQVVCIFTKVLAERTGPRKILGELKGQTEDQRSAANIPPPSIVRRQLGQACLCLRSFPAGWTMSRQRCCEDVETSGKESDPAPGAPLAGIRRSACQSLSGVWARCCQEYSRCCTARIGELPILLPALFSTPQELPLHLLSTAARGRMGRPRGMERHCCMESRTSMHPPLHHSFRIRVRCIRRPARIQPPLRTPKSRLQHHQVCPPSYRGFLLAA